GSPPDARHPCRRPARDATNVTSDLRSPVEFTSDLRSQVNWSPPDPPPADPEMSTYFEQNSTMSCSWRSIAASSRFGSSSTFPSNVVPSTWSQEGTPRCLVASCVTSTIFFDLARWRTESVSPALTRIDAMHARLPFRRTWP